MGSRMETLSEMDDWSKQARRSQKGFALLSSRQPLPMQLSAPQLVYGSQGNLHVSNEMRYWLSHDRLFPRSELTVRISVFLRSYD